MKRLFIGIETDEHLKKIAREFRDLHEPHVSGCRWVKTGNIHLTMRFLGDHPESRIDLIGDSLESAAASIPVFDARTNHFGAFPATKRAKVLWLGVEKDASICNLNRRINAALADLGFPEEERSFSPHITLARLRRPQAVDFGALSEKVDPLHAFTVHEVVLFSSVLTPDGPKYTIHKKAKLEHNFY